MHREYSCLRFISFFALVASETFAVRLAAKSLLFFKASDVHRVFRASHSWQAGSLRYV